MKMTRELIVFLVCSTVYRLFSGALLVSLTWTILNQNEGGYLPLALAIFCSFIPAFVTPMMIKRLSTRMNGRQMSSWFLVCLASLSLVAGGCRDITVGLLIANLFVWLIFMLLEASLDMWFTQVQRGMDEATVRRISGATTATSQAALMIGPLLAAGLMPILTGMGFSILLGVSFLLVAAVCYTRNSADVIEAREGSTLAAPAKLPRSLFIAMVLIWPILGAFNFMLPVYVSIHGWALFELGVLDAVFGMGMALIGVLIILSNTGHNLLFFLSGLIALAVAAALVWFLMPDTLVLKALSLLILGMAFGGARVHIRAAIAYRYSEAAVGLCVSRANALATPVLLLILSLQLAVIETAWLIPFLMITLSIALLLQTSATRFVQGQSNTTSVGA
ncbi:MFS transporter [Pseudomonas sp. CCI3.2]|uniref:MFS transporter n=1 Tax=unclassified Pseudomonas TaxID=196821 RepID=UPI002AC8D62B|nr:MULTISPECIES: MFS transporter [unclassified Pseudomonas]MEB0077589.1 MFS transporter [Pseudomonas sp. MH10out]MEB0089667.1 MFS transporter [Pseudomonas sp. CCI4.2]MEB0101846.1 MFS transporter [Pseudomonas sp. CCI3.2]MEB0128956.1 MFS transporter [Pseudomonas sp. CCI2.4]MEB0157693.1 MFS transporter [Pseudomonas sp. AH2 (2023)]